MREGGFDVVIGNPPFVEYTPRNVNYRLPTTQALATSSCGNLYAFVAERCFALCAKSGKFSFIMPSASLCTPRMAPLFDGTLARFSLCVISLWDERPSKLFEGVDQQLAIFVCGKSAYQSSMLQINAMRHWSSSERSALFQTQGYTSVASALREAQVIPKVASAAEVNLLQKLKSRRFIPSTTRETALLYYKNAGGRYWRLVKSFPTFFSSESGATQTSTEKIRQVNKADISVFVALYSSTIFYWYWRVVSNCRHLTEREFDAFPIKPQMLSDAEIKSLAALGKRMSRTSKRMRFG